MQTLISNDENKLNIIKNVKTDVTIFLSVDEKTHTYSIKKSFSVSCYNPDVFQFNFIIQNLYNNSKIETGITQTQFYHSQMKTGYIKKSINANKILLEYGDVYNKKLFLEIHSLFISLKNDPKFQRKILLNNSFAAMDEKIQYFDQITDMFKYRKLTLPTGVFITI
jgi:hypothetical protein